jgi:hypothetical protein
MRALFEPLRLEQLVLRRELGEPLAQLDLDLRSPRELILGVT